MSGTTGAADGNASGKAARRLHVVLVEPEIPQNTGNVARTCAAVGAALHLVHPLGFDISDRTVKRAGLDYWHLLVLHEYASLDAFLIEHETDELYFFSTRGGRPHTAVSYGSGDPGAVASAAGDVRPAIARAPARVESRSSEEPNPADCYLVFGKETKGLPDRLIAAHPDRVLRIPIREQARSLNLSNAVAVAVYEVLRQWEYDGLTTSR